MPPQLKQSVIEVCQASTCRSRGSEGVLLEIEELSKLVIDDDGSPSSCRVGPSNCLGYCNIGPAAVVLEETVSPHGRRRYANERVFTGLSSLEQSSSVVHQATGKRPPKLEELPPETATRLASLQESRAREYALKTYQWNKAAASSLNDKHALEQIVRKAGYPNVAALPSSSSSSSSSSTTIPMPSSIEKYVPWSLEGVEIVSSHSVVLTLVTDDPKRGTPHPRGRSRRPEPKTWHVTMLGEVGLNLEGPLPWIERDYTPVSTALEWERGHCRILLKVYPEGALTSWLHKQLQERPPQSPLSKIWLSQPIQTLSVPTLVHDGDQTEENSFLPKSILLLLAGTGIVALPQVLAHQDPIRMLGLSTPRRNQLHCPIDVIVSYREDDQLMLPELKEWCTQYNDSVNARVTKGVRNLTILTTQAKGNSTLPFEFDCNKKNNNENGDNNKEEKGDIAMEEESSPPNIRVLPLHRLNQRLVEDSVAEMIHPCRILVSGPSSFNGAAREFLSDLVEPGQVTVLPA